MFDRLLGGVGPHLLSKLFQASTNEQGAFPVYMASVRSQATIKLTPCVHQSVRCIEQIGTRAADRLFYGLSQGDS